jgi:hypothetical protein
MKKGAGGALASMFSKGSKWGGLDIKRVYFGWVPHCWSVYRSLIDKRAFCLQELAP